MTDYSVSPSGEKVPLPAAEDYAGEYRRLERLASEARADGREVVVVMGLGFVGAVMAAIVADSVDADGRPTKFVIGCQRPSTRSYWKIGLLNRGISPIKAEDPEVDAIIARCVLEKRTLTATYDSDCLKLADCVVVDVQCDYAKQELGNMRSGQTDMAALEATLRTIGERIPEHCLVLIETTVAPGTTEFVAWPILKKAFAARGLQQTPLLGHSYERVMPGREYVASIRDFWRVCSGCTEEARARVESFLRDVLNTDEYELTVMDRPIESETAKIVENSYRATILAFLNEWSIFAERNGVDLLKVVDAIKKRPTHDNMIFPGPGIGGYCLPKDGGLGYWAYKHILGFEDGDQVFRMSTAAIDINDTRSLHVATLTRDALRDMGRYIAGAEVLLCGASYRQDVGRHTLQRLRDRRPQAHGDGRRDARPRSLRRALARVREAGVLPRAGTLPVAVLPQPGPPHEPARAEGPRRGAARGRGADPGRAARTVSRALTGRCRGLVGQAHRRGRLLRHPERRQDQAVLRARLRGQGARPRARAADQGRGALLSRGDRPKMRPRHRPSLEGRDVSPGEPGESSGRAARRA